MSEYLQGTLEELTKKVRDYYYAEGYSGEFGRTARFEVDSDDNLVLVGPYYTPFMLFGRGPGKMPPIEPIARWCQSRGITASPWAVAYNIGQYGTRGNNFIERNLVDFEQTIMGAFAKSIEDELMEEFNDK